MKFKDVRKCLGTWQYLQIWDASFAKTLYLGKCITLTTEFDEYRVDLIKADEDEVLFIGIYKTEGNPK